MRVVSICASLLVVAAFSAAAFPSFSTHAQVQPHSVIIDVGFSPGGGYDVYARELARRLGGHLPGRPSVIVENMPGASSLKAIRYLDTGAPRDGTSITAFNPGLVTESLVDPQHIDYRFTNLAWVGSITRDERICYAWGATGIRTFADLLKAPRFALGAPAPGTSSYISAEILKKIFHVKVQEVMGYPGSAEQRIAIERGELDGDCGSAASIPPDWLSGGKIHPLLRFSRDPIAGVPGDPPYIEELTSDPRTKAVLRLLVAADDVGRPYAVSKAVPADTLAALRAGFMATVRDPAFLEDMSKARLPVVFPLDGSQSQAVVESLYATPAEIVDRARKLLAP